MQFTLQRGINNKPTIKYDNLESVECSLFEKLVHIATQIYDSIVILFYSLCNMLFEVVYEFEKIVPDTSVWVIWRKL